MSKKRKKRKDPTTATVTVTPVQADRTKCYACGADVDESSSIVRAYQRIHGYVLTLGPNVDVVICASSRGRIYSPYLSSSERPPKVQCLRVAIEKSGVCPGCGRGPHIETRKVEDGHVYETHAPSTPPGSVCADCRDALQRAKEQRGDRSLTWHVVDFGDLGPYVDYEHRQTVGAKLSELFARSVSSEGRIGPAPTAPEYPRVNLLPRSKASGYGLDRGANPRFLVELTDSQVEALRQLGELWDAHARAIWLDGVEHGGSLLNRLASGEISTRDFDDARTKQAQTIRETREIVNGLLEGEEDDDEG